MVYEKAIKGTCIRLRAVQIDDAEFVIDIRNNKSKNQYIHETSTDVNKQIAWISSQREREGDYYFIATNSGNRIGLISIYNIDLNNKEAELGRWVSIGSPIENVEMAMLMFEFAFDKLGLESVFMMTMTDNSKVRHFWKSFGATIDGVYNKQGIELEREVCNKNDYYKIIRPKLVELMRFNS